jgi:drug/metabolite transporter (DMT)-like permease
MARLLLILCIALVFEAIGVVLLSKGLKEIGQPQAMTASEIFQLIGRGATNINILLGVFFEAIFFVGLLMLMSKSEVTFVWPLTSLSFVMTTLAARFFLHEQVSTTRWVGVCLIMAGAALIIWSEKGEPTAKTEVASQAHSEQFPL